MAWLLDTLRGWMALSSPRWRFDAARRYASEGRFADADRNYAPLLEMEGGGTDFSRGEFAEVLIDAGWCAFQQGRLDEAEGLYRRAASQARRTYVSAELVYRLGLVAEARGDRVAARRSFAEALALQRSSGGDHCGETAAFYWTIGERLLGMNDLRGALKNWRRARQIYAALGRPYKDELAATLDRVARELAAAERFGPAAAARERVIRSVPNTKARSEAAVLGSCQLACLLVDQGEHVRAGEAIRRARERCSQARRELRMQLASAVETAEGFLLAREERFAAAAVHFERALSFGRAAKLDAPARGTTLYNLGLAKAKAGDANAAAPLLREAFELLRLGPDKADALFGLAELSRARGEWTEAERLLREAMAGRSASRERMTLARDWEALGEVHLLSGRPADAADAFHQAATIAAAVLPARHPDRIRMDRRCVKGA